MFLAQFQHQDPARIAAAESNRLITYGELERAASAAAATLRRRGAGPERLVAIRGVRGIDFLIALLGTLRAGAAWLPLDPDTPPERLRRLLDHVRPEVVVDSTESWEGELEPETPEPHQLAYVMFTSGSTGLPKAAMLEHAGMLNHLEAKRAALELTKNDRMAHTAPPTFDISVWQFLAPLRVGARIEFLADEELPDLLRAVAERACTILEVVPSLLRLLLEREPVALPSLRWLIPTGEALTPELARRWLRRYPAIPMLNAYGPTECSDDVTHAVIDREPPPGVTRMPIGFPIPGAELTVQDGELYVGGVVVGRGYRHDPERTAEVFRDGLYRTGDLVRQLPDGSYEYLGRRDHQVKLHGIRVELEEIEAMLSECCPVAAALQADRLVAFHVGPAPDLKAFAARHLPASLVPAHYVQLDALPLTRHGKLDRARLPIASPPQAGGSPAEDNLEAGLVALFSEVLERPAGVTDDFFELGGDSLRAIELSIRLEACFGQRMSPSVLTEDSTPRRLAARLRERREPWPTVVRLQEGEGLPIVLVPGAGGSVVYLRPLARQLQRPVLGLAPPGLDGVTEPFHSLEALARHLVGALPPGPCVLAGHSLGAWTAFEMAKLLGKEVRALAVLDMPARLPRPDDAWMQRVLADLERNFGSQALRGLARMFAAESKLATGVEGHCAGTLHLLRTGQFSLLGPQWGWEKHADHVETHFIPGDHLSLLGEPEVARILTALGISPQLPG